MKLAIHNNRNSYCERWVAYCEQKGISYRLVDCYASDIIRQLDGCDALLWHHQQGSPKDILFARQLLFAVQQSGRVVFPDFATGWHFDDKVGQKYLLEALQIAEFAPTWVFYTRDSAKEWAQKTSFPKVFKLRNGAGSQNVRLVNTRKEALALIDQAFGRGFDSYDRWGSLQERYRKFRAGKAGILEVVKGAVRLIVSPPYARVLGRQKGYVYFQEFFDGNSFDIRIIVIDGKAFALKRFVRANDFRASGSGIFSHAKEEIDERFVGLALDYTRRMSAQCVAFDFVYNSQNEPALLEVNFGFAPGGYVDCPGYWDEQLAWHPGSFDPYGWMIELVIKQIKKHDPSNKTISSS